MTLSLEVALRTRLGRVIGDELAMSQTEIERELAGSPVPLIRELSEYVALAGGKRLRPILVLLSARLAGGSPARAARLGCLVELLHTATLIHDDVVDRAPMRRGRPSANARWGDDAALLVGDHLYSRCMALLVADADLAVMDALASAMVSMTEAEVFQLERKRAGQLTETDYLRIIRQKTATFISACCRIGGLTGGLDRAGVEALSAFGEHLGIAFQIIDDSLDFDADEARLGKAIGADLREGKRTLPLIATLERARPDEQARILDVLRAAGLRGRGPRRPRRRRGPPPGQGVRRRRLRGGAGHGLCRGGDGTPRPVPALRGPRAAGPDRGVRRPARPMRPRGGLGRPPRFPPRRRGRSPRQERSRHPDRGAASRRAWLARGGPRAGRASGIVTLLTDFGVEDPYVGIVKGVILAINPAARLVDLTHAIPPQDVRRGALALEAAYRFFPPGTVHLAVVDPGVGGPRRPLAVRADGHVFVGPDNGLLGFCAEQAGARAVALTDPRYYRAGRRGVSRTFHARDIFAPVAGHCSRGVTLDRLGSPVSRVVRLAPARPRRAGGRVVGEVLLADRFGNLLTNVSAGDLGAAPAACRLSVAGRRIDGLVSRYGDRPVGALGALSDSSGRVEIFVRDGSARARLGVGPGARVSFSWSSPRSKTSSRSRTRKASGSTEPRTIRRRPRSLPRPKSWPRPRSWPARRSRPISSRPPSPSSGTRTDSRSRTSRRPSG